MTRLPLALAAATALLATPAQAVPKPFTDLPCQFAAAEDPYPEAPENTRTGIVSAGPIVAADQGNLNGNPVRGTVTCTMRAGSSTVPAAASGTGVILLPPTLLSFTALPSTPVYVCTKLDLVASGGGTATYYWDAQDGWTTDAAADCPFV